MPFCPKDGVQRQGVLLGHHTVRAWVQWHERGFRNRPEFLALAIFRLCKEVVQKVI